MQHWIAIPLLLASVAARGEGQRAPLDVTGGALTVRLTEDGSIAAFHHRGSARNYRYLDAPAPLLTLVSGAQRLAPTSLTYARSRSGKLLTLSYAPAGVSIGIRVRERATHLALDIVSASPSDKIDAVIWGPYPTIINEIVGEVIGVVRDGDIAIGLQVLNPKTLGGDMPNDEGSTWARGIAATHYPWGSTLQAYSINRDRARTVDAWGGLFKRMPVPALPGETVVGSAIALFSSPAPTTLDVLERIEIAEGLPHPTIDGVWFRRSPLFERSYMISSFGEGDADEMIAYAKRAGLYSLYHEGPFASWGHFVLSSEQFPHGRAGLKGVVDKARAAGLHLGVHTLTNFINTNDPYVTPIPDDRLSVRGSSPLVLDIDAVQQAIEVRSPEFFADGTNDNLHTVKIGQELIQFRAVSTSAPYLLLDCQRGAFGTTPAAHRAGTAVAKLFDHAYKVFFPNFAMQREVARNLADFLNETGVDHIDFDGHEGALASGEGDFALAVFARDVLDQTKHDLINGTSISKTYYWHIGSYYNWGEPWYGGFRESMQQYRIDNQALFDRNFMPHMLGWYLLTETTTLGDMEWMLARAAGYGAGFAMVARPSALRTNPQTPQLLDAIREWEDARAHHAFTAEQQARLRDASREFHLETAKDGTRALHEIASSPVYTRQKFQRQPGEPTDTEWSVTQEWAAQRLRFRLRVVGPAGLARNFVLRIDRYATIALPVALNAGESLVCDGTDAIVMYDALGKFKTRFTLAAPPPVVAPGVHTIQLDSSFGEDQAPTIEVQFKGVGRGEAVRAMGR